MKNKYEEILEEVKQGKSLKKIAKERNVCVKNISRLLRKRFPKQYDLLIYGKIIGKYKDNILRKIPKTQTDRTECDITKKAKKLINKQILCIEEVGVLYGKRKIRYTIDLYSIEKKIGFELCWTNKNSKDLIKRFKKYKELFGNVYCVLLKDSSIRNRNKNYMYLPKRLEKARIKTIIFDISNSPSLTETV